MFSDETTKEVAEQPLQEFHDKQEYTVLGDGKTYQQHLEIV